MLGPTLILYDLTLIYVCKELAIRSHSQVLVGHEIWETLFNPVYVAGTFAGPSVHLKKMFESFYPGRFAPSS